MSNSLLPHGLQHSRLLCPTVSPEVCTNSLPLTQWCYPAIVVTEMFILPSFRGRNSMASIGGPGEGNGNPLQCSCLENPRDRGACWAAICGVSQSQTRLTWPSSSSKHTSRQPLILPRASMWETLFLYCLNCSLYILSSSSLLESYPSLTPQPVISAMFI